MTVVNELQTAFSQLESIFEEDHNTEILDMAYAEFTLKCYIGYANRIYETILNKNAPLSAALCAIGIDIPRDQLLILLNTFYLSRHSNTNSIH